MVSACSIRLAWVCIATCEMAAFDLNTFVSNPTLSQFDKCRKSDLHELAEYYDVPV